jgi:DNA-binding CsgD family transcriptional regulator/ArsR family metal-binding transcriptional regulator
MDPVTTHIGYHHFYTCTGGPMSKPGSKGENTVMAIFHFDTDASYLFPYINAVRRYARLIDNPSSIRFKHKDIHCVIYPTYGVATPLKDRVHAGMFRDEIMAYLNTVRRRMNEIVPKHKIYRKFAVTDIISLLPKTNCRKCGYPSCMAFASMLSMQREVPSACPYIGLPVKEQVTYPVYDICGRIRSSVTLEVDTVQSAGKNRNMSGSVRGAGSDGECCDEGEMLTKRECQVLTLLSVGKTNRQISDRLGISHHTVKSHVVHIFNKLGVNDRTQAAVWAARQKIV